MPEDKKTKDADKASKASYVVSGGSIKFNGKWYKPQTTIELTVNQKKQILGTNKTQTHIKLTKVG